MIIAINLLIDIISQKNNDLLSGLLRITITFCKQSVNFADVNVDRGCF